MSLTVMLFKAMLCVNLSGILPDLFLEKVDRTTMAHSMEIRVPFFDNELVDHALGLRASDKLRGGKQKSLLRQALTGIEPQEILNAPKSGIEVPYQAWLRGPLQGHMRELLCSPQSRLSGMFDRVILRKMLQEHVAGARDHGFLLWKTLQLAIWMEEYDVTYG